MIGASIRLVATVEVVRRRKDRLRMPDAQLSYSAWLTA